MSILQLTNAIQDEPAYGDNYFGVVPFLLLFFFASARRSVFLRRAARFFAFVLPWLCPIRDSIDAARRECDNECRVNKFGRLAPGSVTEPWEASHFDFA
jgi:hypothetical protein